MPHNGKLKGVVVPVVTPLNEERSIDEPGLKRLVSFLLDCKVHGIFANGSMGGFALLPDALQYRAIEIVANLVGGRIPVLAGASETSTERVLEKIKVIQEMDVDSIVVLSPYYYILRQDEIRRFFEKIADTSSKPIILYDNPRMTNNPIEVETIVQLAQHENIHGLKISTPDVYKWQELLRSDLPRHRFALIAGVEKMMNLPLQLGFDGITGGLHNLIPNVAIELYDTMQRGDFEEGDHLQQRINRFHKVFEIDGGWRATEIAFQLMGIAQKVTSHQYEVGISAEKRNQIVDILEAEKLLRPYPALETFKGLDGSKARVDDNGHSSEAATMPFAKVPSTEIHTAENAVLNLVE